MVDKPTLMRMQQEADELNYRVMCCDQFNAMHQYKIALDMRLEYLRKGCDTNDL